MSQNANPVENQSNKFPKLLWIIIILVGIFIISIVLTIKKPTEISKTQAPPESTTPSGAEMVEIVDSGTPLAPKIIDMQPQKGKELPLSGKIVIQFDQPMNTETGDEIFKVIDDNGKEVAGKTSWEGKDKLQFVPESELTKNSVYQVIITEKAVSAKGVALSEPISVFYNTPGELVISQVFPADGATNIANNAVITVIFNRPVVPLVISEEQSNLPSPLEISPKISGQGEWISTSVYAFRPDKALKGATEYCVRIKAGLQDADKTSQLSNDYSWKFKTVAPSIGQFMLGNNTVNPQDYYQNVLLDEFFVIDFLQPMNKTSTEDALSISIGENKSIELTKTWNSEATQLIITPTQRLQLATNYILSLKPEAKAEDGGSLSSGLLWNFTTVQAPAVKSIYPSDQSTQDTYSSEISIQFVSPMKIDTVKEKIVLSPAPKQKLEWWYNEWDWSFHAYVLEPSTRYTLQLLPGMTDIYGNQITTTSRFSFTTAAYSPQANLEMPYTPALFRANNDPQYYSFYANLVNVKSVDFQLFKLSSEQFISLVNGSISQWEYNPPIQNLVWSLSDKQAAKLNERKLTKYQMAMQNGEPLAPGFYFLTLNSPDVYHTSPFLDTRFIIVANGNLTFKTTQTESLIWYTDLESGKPVSGVKLVVYDKYFKPLNEGISDADGLVSMNISAPEDPYEPRYAISSDGTNFGFAVSDWGSGASFDDYGIWSTYYTRPDQPTAYLYTDRPIYRPGQPVYFKGILRLDDDLKYSLPDYEDIEINIQNYEKTVFTQTLKLSRFGSFDGEYLLDKEATLGSYTINVMKPDSQNVFSSVSFNVAEYRKPEFLIDVTASPENVLNGSSFDITLNADYYSGGSVGGADVDWKLFSSPFAFTPPSELSVFSFIDYNEDALYVETEIDYASKLIAEGKEKTDNKGKLKINLPANIGDSKTSRQFEFEATLTDLAGSQVSSRTSAIVHRSDYYVGVRSLSYVGEAGKEQSCEAVVVDWEGKPISERKVSIDIIERRWYSVQEQDAEGNIEWKNSVEEIPVESISDLITDSNGKVTFKFTPKNGGIFKVTGKTLDEHENEARASTYIWVAGKDYIPWVQTNDRSFKLVADKTDYKPGEEAEILIASPFQGDAYALLTVERGHVRYKEVLKLSSNSTLYKLPITNDMAPNIYVSVIIVKGVDETNTRPNFKIGIVKLNVDVEQYKVNVEVAPDKPTAGPGDEITYTVYTTDYQGKPVDTEVSLGLSDLATLSLSGPNSIPIMDYFYASRSLSVWTSVSIVTSIEDFNALIAEKIAEGERSGSGGGKGEGDLGVLEVRGNFPDTAYWNARVETGEDGKESVKITLPDNLTTWRMDARAVSSDTLVGQTITDIVTTKPLLVRPQTPRFFVIGDQSTVGAAVHNNTDQPMSVDVAIEAKGVTLKNDPKVTIDVPAKQQAYVSWDVAVDMDATRVDFVFSATGGSYSDASRPTLGTLDGQGIPVYRYEVPETVATSGQITTTGSVVETLNLPTEYPISKGKLEIEFSPSLAAGMTSGLNYLEHYKYECIEQTISRFLPNVTSTRALVEAGVADNELAVKLGQQVGIALQRVYSWQNTDGGWGWWGTQKSDVQTSAYVVLGLVEAKEAGYSVESSVINKGINFLHSQLLPISRLSESYMKNQQAFVLYVLERAGKPNVSYAVKLYDQRQSLSYFARAFLMNTLFSIDESDTRVNTLLSDLNSAAILSATGTHWEEKEIDFWNWNTDTRTTAIVLAMISEIDPENPINANAARWLMSNRTNGHWQGTQETAWTLMALTNWMVESGELKANYHYAVGLNGEKLGGGTADASTLRDVTRLQVDIEKLLKDEANRLVFARDEGEGTLYYSAYLNLSLPVEQIKALDNGIIVTRSYYAENNLKKPVTEAKWGDRLYARITVVVPHDLHYVVIDDPLPAGLEAVDQSLMTSPQGDIPTQLGWNEFEKLGWGWWYFDHIEMHDERVTLSASYLPAGTYIYNYMVRAGTQGVYRVIPTTAYEFYFPEVYGRSDGSLFTVKP